MHDLDATTIDEVIESVYAIGSLDRGGRRVRDIIWKSVALIDVEEVEPSQDGEVLLLRVALLIQDGLAGGVEDLPFHGLVEAGKRTSLALAHRASSFLRLAKGQPAILRKAALVGHVPKQRHIDAVVLASGNGIAWYEWRSTGRIPGLPNAGKNSLLETFQNPVSDCLVDVRHRQILTDDDRDAPKPGANPGRVGVKSPAYRAIE